MHGSFHNFLCRVFLEYFTCFFTFSQTTCIEWRWMFATRFLMYQLFIGIVQILYFFVSSFFCFCPTAVGCCFRFLCLGVLYTGLCLCFEFRLFCFEFVGSFFVIVLVLFAGCLRFLFFRCLFCCLVLLWCGAFFFAGLFFWRWGVVGVGFMGFGLVQVVVSLSKIALLLVWSRI